MRRTRERSITVSSINEMRQFGFNNMQGFNETEYAHNNMESPATKGTYVNLDPSTIIKRRLAKGEISKKEYEELRKAIQI